MAIEKSYRTQKCARDRARIARWAVEHPELLQQQNAVTPGSDELQPAVGNGSSSSIGAAGGAGRRRWWRRRRLGRR